MSHKEHEHEREADAAMANPDDVRDEPEAAEQQPETVRHGSDDPPAGEREPE